MIRTTFNKLTDRRLAAPVFALFALICSAAIAANFARSRAAEQTPAIGERLTYNVSFERFDNVAYFQLFTASRGRLSGKDAIEYRATAKTYDLLGAAFLSIDETRQTFASPETGYPLFATRTQNTSVEPKQTTSNFLTSPSSTYDMLTLLAKARDAGGAGSFGFTENDKIYTAVFSPIGSEKVKTVAGDFDTTLSTVDSSFLTDQGITEFRINFTSDDEKVPVLIRFKIKKGVFRIALASRDIVEPEVDATPTPSGTATPIVAHTPRPTPSPTPYIDNQPLSLELPFSLGETLEYALSSGGRNIGQIALAAKERKEFAGEDSLLLTATVKDLVQGQNLLGQSDSLTAHVDPDSLTPQQFDMRFAAGLSSFTQSVKFDQGAASATFGQGKTADIPVGTHSLLSFLYAVRTINLTPSKDLNNPVNDTRVAVFWNQKAYVFTLRPSNAMIADAAGKRLSCLMVAVSTGDPQLDQLGLRIWLSNDARRLPLRITLGGYQADLIQP